ncbi:MAG: hypothetical protein ABII97_00215 [Patescibacteria group bacterium]
MKNKNAGDNKIDLTGITQGGRPVQVEGATVTELKGDDSNTVMAEAAEKAQATAEKKAAKKDPFALDIGDPNEVLGDLEEAKKQAEAEEVRKAEMDRKLLEFQTKVFPTMAQWVAYRERARNTSKFAGADATIVEILMRKGLGHITKTAFLVAATGEDGVKDENVLLQELLLRGLVRKAGPKDVGTIKLGKDSFVLGFEILPDYRVSVLQALRERLGGIEAARRVAAKEREAELLAYAGLTPWELFNGKKGTFALRRPYEEVPQRQGDPWKYYPGILAGESDGDQITIIGGTGGCEKSATAMNKAGLVLKIKALNDENFFTKRDDLKPLIPVHRTLWAIARHQENCGMGPDAVTAVEELKKTKGLVKPETFFKDSANRAQKTLIVYEVGDGDSAFWKWYKRDGSQKDHGGRDNQPRSYDPMYNVAMILSRGSTGDIAWTEIPEHLTAMMGDIVGRNLEPDKKKDAPNGAGMALYKWAKKRYSLETGA